MFHSEAQGHEISPIGVVLDLKDQVHAELLGFFKFSALAAA
jgi:hypothetical protein